MTDSIWECNCPDWKENLPIINDAFAFKVLHGSNGYEGKPFIYCPWCGKKL